LTPARTASINGARRPQMPPDMTHAGVRSIDAIAADLGIPNECLFRYGEEMAKVSLSLLDEPRKRSTPGRLILVSAITPTPAAPISILSPASARATRWRRSFSASCSACCTESPPGETPENQRLPANDCEYSHAPPGELAYLWVFRLRPTYNNHGHSQCLHR